MLFCLLTAYQEHPKGMLNKDLLSHQSEFEILKEISQEFSVPEHHCRGNISSWVFEVKLGPVFKAGFEPMVGSW